MDDEFGFADAFARRLDQAAWAERRFEDEDSIAAAGFGFEELSRGVAADLFVGGPEEDEAFLNRNLGMLQSLQGKERLHDAGLHVENTRTVGFAGGDTEGHFGERAGGVDSVVMAEHQKLSRRAGFVRPPGGSQMIATEFLRDAFDACAALAPG